MASVQSTVQARVTWVNEPILPGRFGIVMATDATQAEKLVVRRLADGPAGTPGSAEATVAEVEHWPIVSRQDECLTVDVPAGEHGVFLVGVDEDTPGEMAWAANRPVIHWHHPHEPTPGEALRFKGRQLLSPLRWQAPSEDRPISGAVAVCEGVQVMARSKVGGGDWQEWPIEKASAYEVWLNVPEDWPVGETEISVHNGHGGPAGWSEPVTITIAAPAPWPTQVFRVEDYRSPEHTQDADSTRDDKAIAAAVAAAGQNGGGVIELADRIYMIRQSIVLPRYVTLRGQGRDRTLIKAPESGSENPPYTMVTGDGDFVVEDLRIIGYSSQTTLIAAPAMLHESFDDTLNWSFNADTLKWNFGWGKPEGIRARNVSVRRCHLSQRFNFNYWRRGADRAFLDRLHKFFETGHTDAFTAVRMRGDHIEVTDCEILGGGSAIGLHGCTHVRIANNILRAGPGGIGVNACTKLIWPDNPAPGEPKGAKIIGNYSRFLLIENNQVTPWSERGRGGIFIWFGGEDCHIARNSVTDLQRCYDCEAVGTHLWMARWPSPKLEMITPTRGRIIDPQGEVADEILEGGAIEIVEGRGTGQLRRIIARDGDKVELEKPWITEPDATSVTVFTAPPPFERVDFIDNTIERVGPNVTLWGNTRNSMVDGNLCREGMGIQIWTVRLAPDQKVWGGSCFNQVLNNCFETGWAMPAPGNAPGSDPDQDLLDQSFGTGVISTIYCGDNNAPDHGYDFLGLTIRNNITRGHSGVVLKRHWQYPNRSYTHKTAGLIVEDHLAQDSTIGLLIDEGNNVVTRNNRFEDVQFPLVDLRNAAQPEITTPG